MDLKNVELDRKKSLTATLRLKNITELLKESKPYDKDGIFINKAVRDKSIVNEVFFKQDKVRHRQKFAAL